MGRAPEVDGLRMASLTSVSNRLTPQQSFLVPETDVILLLCVTVVQVLTVKCYSGTGTYCNDTIYLLTQASISNV